MDRRNPRAAGALTRLIGADGLALMAGFASSVVVARALGPSGRGVVALVTVTTVLSAGMVSLPLANAVAVEVGRDARAAVSAALAWVLLVGPAGAVCWGAAALFADELWDLQGLTVFALAGAGWLAVVASNLLRGVLVGETRFAPVASGRVVFAVALLAGNAVLAVADALTAPRSIAVLFGAIGLQGLVYWKALGRPHGVRLPEAMRRRSLGYAARAQVGAIARTVLGRVDLILVGAFLGVADAGIYAVALVIAEAAWLAIDGVGLVMLGGAASGRTDVARAAWATRLTVALGCAAAALIAIAALPLLPAIFGDEFDASYGPLAAMLPGVIGFAAWRVTMSDAAGRDRPELESVSAAIGASLLIAACLILIPSAGVVGAALASSFAYLATAAAGLTSYARRFGLPFGQLVLPRRGDLRRAASALRRA